MERPCKGCAEVKATRYMGFAIAKVWAGKKLMHQVVLSDRHGIELSLRRAIGWCEEQGCNWICKQTGEGVAHLYTYANN